MSSSKNISNIQMDKEEVDRLLLSYQSSESSIINELLKFMRDRKFPKCVIYKKNSKNEFNSKYFGCDKDTTFRCASITKPITAAIIKSMFKSELDQSFMHFININVNIRDKRIYDITIRHLIDHTSGFDNMKSFRTDPMFTNTHIDKLIDQYFPTIYLASTPGVKYSYSNFGYALLGHIIEQRDNYLEYVKKYLGENVYLGETNKLQPNETKYYFQENMFNIEPMVAHGGLVVNPIDLCNFGLKYIISGKLIGESISDNFTHFMTGSFPGATCILYQRKQKDLVTSCVLMFNSRTVYMDEDIKNMSKICQNYINEVIPSIPIEVSESMEIEQYEQEPNKIAGTKCCSII